MSVPWVYNAKDGESRAVLPKIGRYLSLSGQNIRIIDAKLLGSNGDLIIRHAPKLQEIIGMADIQDGGLNIRFEQLTKPEIKLNLMVNNLTVPDQANHRVVRIENHSPLTYLSSDAHYLPTKKSGLVVHFPEPDLKEIRLYGSCQHLVIMGSNELEKLTLSGEGIIENLELKNSPNLQVIDIRQRVITASVEGCEQLKTLKGFGDVLNIGKRPRNSRLEIGGFWLNIPRWYSLKQSTLRINHFEASVSLDDLSTCADMGGITVEELAPGLAIEGLVKAILRGELRDFESWAHHCVSRFDEYIAMRILVALAFAGYNEAKILSTRLILSQLNREAPILPLESVDRNMNLNYSIPYTARPRDKNTYKFPEWYTPINSIMPFSRLDLEIYLNTLYSDFWLDFKLEPPSVSFGYRYMTGGDPRLRQMMASVFACAKDERAEGRAKERLKHLVKDIYLDVNLAENPHCCEFLIHHLGQENINCEQIIKTLLKNIMAAHSEDWTKRALVAALIFKTNYSPARTVLLRLKSQRKIGLAESKKAHAITIAGQRAFEEGKLGDLEWPYLDYWMC